MPNEFLGYKDQLWKVSQRFSYTGSPQEISLDAGTYLLMCKGARGGSAAGHPSYGGLSVGKLTLASSATMYAYVGGNGHTYGVDGDADGGWNGGGDGGSTASGGGGATDIRLSRPDDIPDPSQRIPPLPSEYQQVEYIETISEGQYIDLGIAMTKSCEIRAKINIPSISDDMTLIGANGSASTDKWKVVFDSGMTVDISDIGAQSTGVTAGTAAVFDLSWNTVKVNNTTEIPFVVPSTNKPASQNMYLFANNNNGTADLSTRFAGRLHYMQIVDSEITTRCPYYMTGPVNCSQSGRGYSTAACTQFACMATCIWEGSRYCGPYVVTNESVSGGLYSPYGANNAFTYNGETWYESGTGGWMQVDVPADGFGNIPSLPVDIDAYDTSHAAKIFLDYVFETYGQKNVIAELIPCYRKSDGVVGLYDTVSGTFITGAVAGATFARGDAGSYPVPAYSDNPISPEEYMNNMSLLTRIMVAGGGGGRNEQSQYATPSYDYNGYGGGIIGGPIDASNASTFHGQYADQESGNAFGIGADATGSSCGAGGGWYGGYAATSGDYGANGGGGSGYVLTADSYKPSDYGVSSDYNMTDTFMTSSKSAVSEVIIYEQATADELKRDDTILFIPTADQCNITLNAGEYKLQCWGGGGGTTEVFTQNTFPQGGYAEGVLTLDEPTEIAVNVAGSGCGAYTFDASKMYVAFPDLSANGGGMIWSQSDSVITDGGCGGGATDIGIATTDESVYTIPNEYQPVDYAEFTGSQYIDTGIVLNGRSNVEFCITPVTGRGWQQIFGASQRNFVNELSFWINGLAGAGMRYSTNDRPKSYTFSATEKYIYRNIYSKLYINDTLVDAQNLVPTLNTVNTARIGGVDPDHNYVWSGKFHYLIIKDNTKTIQYLIPCIEVSSSEVGFYDLITGTFLRNAGSGTLTAGSNISQRDYTVVDTSDGLNSRIIVAGGAGGSSSYRSNIGGAGGGTTGGAYSGSTGSNPGPGTQTESPQDVTYPQLSGSFGFGGTGISHGAGGGAGWYGGGGSYCNSTVSSNMSGAGGSGFVYTADASTPVTYDVDPKYQLTDTSFSRPTSQNPDYEYDIYFMPRAMITVLGSSGVLFLCRDTQGVKYYDDTSHQWLLTQEALSEALFQSKGYATIPTDTGLLDAYEILVYDPTDDVGTLEMNVCPSTQHITGTITANIAKENIDRIVVDTEYNPSEYTVAANITTTASGTNSTTVTLDISIDKLVANESAFGKVYSIILYGKDELL